MHIARLGPDRGCNLAYYIRHDPEADDPDATRVVFLSGDSVVYRGDDRDAFLRRIADMDPPPKAEPGPPGKAGPGGPPPAGAGVPAPADVRDLMPDPSRPGRPGRRRG